MWIVLLHDESEDDTIIVYAAKGPFDTEDEAREYCKGEWGCQPIALEHP